MQWLLSAVFNSFASFLHILAKAVGRVAAHADDGQKRGDAEQNDDTFE